MPRTKALGNKISMTMSQIHSKLLVHSSMQLMHPNKRCVTTMYLRVCVCFPLPSNQRCYRLIAGYWRGGGDHEVPRG